MNTKKIGILLKPLPTRGTDAHPASPLGFADARELSGAFLADLLARLNKLKKVSVTVFHGDDHEEPPGGSIRRGAVPAERAATPPRGRIGEAFRTLITGEGQLACIVGAESPDVPLVYIKRTYVKLKHKDVVLGPTVGGGLYLIGLRGRVPGLFDDLSWGQPSLLAETLRRVEAMGITCALLPPWYEVNSPESLAFLETMVLARRIEKKDRLPAVERVLGAMRKRPE